MNSKIRVVLAVIFVVGLAYWGLMRYSAKEFEHSKLGAELSGAMQTCRNAQLEGMLPGVPAGDLSGKLALEGDHYDYADRDDVTYPMQTGCTVTYGDQTITFHMRKENKDTPWIVIGAAPDGMSGAIRR
jgi:hypothetical protein